MSEETKPEAKPEVKPKPKKVKIKVKPRKVRKAKAKKVAPKAKRAYRRRAVVVAAPTQPDFIVQLGQRLAASFWAALSSNLFQKE